MDKIRYGIIGMGLQGTKYADILYDGLNNSILSAVSTTSIDKAKVLKEKYDGVEIFEDYKSMILSKKVDAIITTCPSYYHTEMAEFAIKNGVHVLGEKPAGVYGKSVDKLNKVVSQNPDISYGIIFNQRTNTIYQNIKKIVESGELGEFRRINWIENSWYRNMSYYNSASWRASFSYEGGGLIINQAQHTLDLFYYMVGIPKNVYAKTLLGYNRDVTVDTDVSVIFEYENGATGTYVSSTHDMMGTNRLEIDLSKGKIIVENGECSIYTFFDDEKNVNTKMTMKQFNEIDKVYVDKKVIKNETTSPYHTIIENFSLNILKKTPLIADGIEGLHSVNIANAINLSNHLKAEVSIPVDSNEYLKFLNEKIAEEGLTDKRYN